MVRRLSQTTRMAAKVALVLVARMRLAVRAAVAVLCKTYVQPPNESYRTHTRESAKPGNQKLTRFVLHSVTTSRLTEMPTLLLR
jgi:hypothetical protein